MKMPVIDKNIIIIVTGRVLQIGLTLATVRIFTSLLSATEVGNLYLLNSILGLIGLSLLNPIGMYMNRNLHRWTLERSVLSHFSLFNAYLVPLSLLSAGFMFVLYSVMHIGAGMELRLLLTVISLFVLINTWNTVIIPTLNLLNYQKSFVFFTLLTLLLSLLLSSLFSLYVQATALYWIAGQVLAQAIVNVFAFRHFRKIVRGRVDVQYMRSVLTKENLFNVISFIMPLVITTFCIWLQGQSYRIIIAREIGAKFLGMIGLGLAIASNIAAVAESLAQQLFYPAFYREINTSDPAKREQEWNTMARSAFPVYLSLTVMTSFLAPQLIRLLASDRFLAASPFIVYGAWIELFRMVTGMLTTIAHSEMQTRHLMKAYFVGGVLAVAGTLIAARMPFYEHSIPALLLFSGLVTLAIMYHDMRRLMVIAIDPRFVRRSVLASLPYMLVFLIPAGHSGLVLDTAIIAGCGLYFMISQYRLFRLNSGGTLTDA